jgi:hypothetical protein
MTFERIPVECYSGYKANERPMAFTFHDRRWEVAEIVDRWYEGNRETGRPEFNYFKVRISEGKTFLLRCNTLLSAWDIAVPNTSKV